MTKETHMHRLAFVLLLMLCGCDQSDSVPPEPGDSKLVHLDVWHGYYRALVNWDYHTARRKQFAELGDLKESKVHEEMQNDWRELSDEWKVVMDQRRESDTETLRSLCAKLNKKRAALEELQPQYPDDRAKVREAQVRVNKTFGYEE